MGCVIFLLDYKLFNCSGTITCSCFAVKHFSSNLVELGDVDLCLLSPDSVQALLTLKLKLRPAIEDVLDIPVDLVTQSTQQSITLVTQQAMQTGIRLI
jgi:hypothetical protein